MPAVSRKAPAKGVKPQRRFQFIDNSNTAANEKNSTQVRRHVMQEYMREKRWEARSKSELAIHRDDNTVVPQHEDIAKVKVPGRIPRKRRKDEFETVQLDPSEETDSKDSESGDHIIEIKREPIHWRAPGPFFSLIDSRQQQWVGNDSSRKKLNFQLTPSSFAVLADLFPPEPPSPSRTISTGQSWSPSGSVEDVQLSPLSVLSAARTDPFNALPLVLNIEDQKLFDFYAFVMPSCSYGFERRHPNAHNWYRDVFIPEAMKGKVTFQNTILVHAANTQAWVRGLTETELALEHRDRATSVLKEHYDMFPEDTSDAIITATMSAAALEDFDPQIERRKYAWIHWNAAMHKIRQRGGPAMLEYIPSLRKLVNWQDYIFSGYDGRGSSFYFTPDAILDTTNDNEKKAYGRMEIRRQCEEFFTFLRCTEQLASVAANQLHNPLAKRNQMLRYSVFTESHPLYVLLASPNKGRFVETGQLKQIISRLGALMMINVAIWEYRHDNIHSEAFFEELVNNIYYNELHDPKNISVEALLQILLSGSDNPILRHTERPWLVGRLLKVAKRLSRSNWERLEDFLLSCLTLDDKFRVQMNDWEAELRQEILQAPLFSHRLPLMEP